MTNAKTAYNKNVHATMHVVPRVQRIICIVFCSGVGAMPALTAEDSGFAEHGHPFIPYPRQSAMCFARGHIASAHGRTYRQIGVLIERL
ncbi:MAG: hypothetical protein LBU67_08620 [Oscillospiraceae bacterium]|nr:hypothetical protein [Oscillospiraceae bacterium]